MDARFDTSKLGFEIHQEYSNIRIKDFKRIKLQGGIDKSLENFYNDYYKLALKGSTDKLLMVLKTLWIDNIPNVETNEKVRYDIERATYQNIHVKIEYYVEKIDKYYPIKRLDTVYQLTESILNSTDFKFKKNDLSFFTYVLKSLIEKYDFKDLTDGFVQKRQLSLSNIDSFNKKRFLLPILTAPIINKGVFKNFKEFSNNTASINEVELIKKKGEYYWANKNNGEMVSYFFLMSDSLGLSTGARKRIEAVRQSNTFEFFELSYIYLPKSVVGNMLGTIPENTYRYPWNSNKVIAGDGARLQYVLAPRQINMETGLFY